MTTRNVSKNLAAQQDMLPGLGPYNQTRRGANILVDGPAKSYIELWKEYCGAAYVGTFEDGFTADLGAVAVSLTLGIAYIYKGVAQAVIAPSSLPSSDWVELPVAVTSLRTREALRRSYADAGYTLEAGSFEAGGTLTTATSVLLSEASGKAYTGAGPYPQVVTAGTIVTAPGFIDKSTVILRGQLPSPPADLLFKGSAIDPTGIAPGTSVTRGFEHAYYPVKAGALRVGGSDLLPLNDERNFWRGLPDQNAWGAQDNIGLYSAAFNRNGASFGLYSTTFGHDCVAYGTASIAGGAGSCTGNPDTVSELFNGYCSFSFGKNNLAAGEKCAALGEENLANTRASLTLGYSCSTQPSVLTPQPTGAMAIGNNVFVTGQGGALGRDISVADGIVIGAGANPGSKLVGNVGELSLGYNTTLPAIRHAGNGASRGKLGINNSRELEHEVDIDLGDGATLGVTVDSFSSAKLSLRGLNSSGLSHPIADIVWTNPNSGSSQGELVIRMNGRSSSAFAISATGSVRMEELKTTGAGEPAGTLYRDGGFIKVV